MTAVLSITTFHWNGIGTFFQYIVDYLEAKATRKPLKLYLPPIGFLLRVADLDSAGRLDQEPPLKTRREQTPEFLAPPFKGAPT